MRADQLLVERGIAVSRAQAQRLIAVGGVEVDWRSAWKPIGKNGEELPSDAALRVTSDAELRFVSRGGLKLEGALAQTGFDVRELDCLDVGQSTGGFTDCLLQAGAARVVGVDVGHGQLDARLAADPRVVGLEGINARSLDAAQLIAQQQVKTSAYGRFDPENAIRSKPIAAFDLITGDLSFISLTLVLPALLPLLKPGGALLLLVKPQFELENARQVGKGGIVRDAQRFLQVERRLRAAFVACGLSDDAVQWFDSCISGGDGNREFFIFAIK
ncbi:MAG: TlyA family RNA methyltransferase [Burkholderiales bacterium]